MEESTAGLDGNTSLSVSDGLGDVITFEASVDWGALEVLLAIASPSPPKTDSGKENSASQCRPLTQLNRPIPT